MNLVCIYLEMVNEISKSNNFLIKIIKINKI